MTAHDLVITPPGHRMEAGASQPLDTATPPSLVDGMSGAQLLLFAGISYFAASRVGFWLVLQPEGIAPISPATGVGLALMALSKPRQWKWVLPGIAAAELSANIGLSRPISMALCFMAARLTELLFGAIVLTGFGRDRVDFSAIRHFTRLLLVVAPVCAFSACIAALVVPLGYVSDCLHFWRLWLTTDGLGILVVTPLLLNMTRGKLRWPGLVRGAEALLLVASGSFVAWFIIWTDVSGHFHVLRFPFLLTIPVMLWASLRMGVMGTVAIACQYSVVAAIGINHGHRPFLVRGLSDGEIYFMLQVLVMGWASCGLILSIAISQNQGALAGLQKEKELLAASEARLRQSRQELIDVNTSLALFRALIDRTSDGIEVLDAHTGRFLDVNEKSCTNSGYTREELLTMGVFDVNPFLSRETFDETQEALKNSGSVTRETINRRRDGTTFPVEVNLRRVELDRAYVVAIVRDITERKRAEELLRQSHHRFKALADAAFEGICISDGGRIIDFNDQYARILGYDRDELIGREIASIIDPENRDAVMERARSGVDIDIEIGAYRKDGSEILVESHGRTTVLNGRKVRIAAVRDVTERKRAEEELRRRQAEIRRLERINTLAHMAAGLAHELNQPLAAILNYSSGSVGMLRDAGTSAEQILPALEAISAEAKRAGDIIGWLRSFVRRQGPTHAPLDVNVRIRRTVELMKHELDKARIALSLDLSEPLPNVMGGSVQIDQVLVNLIRNAIEAMQSGNAIKPVLAIRSSLQHGFVRVDVTDLGCGVSPDDAGSIFEPFFTTKPDGIGMGLAISRAIVIECGGELTANPGQHGGMTMTFTLPVETEVNTKGAMP